MTTMSNSKIHPKINSRKPNSPPWCSLGQKHENMKPRKPTPPLWRRRSESPPRDSIWDVLQEGKGARNMKTKNVSRANFKMKVFKIPILFIVLILFFSLLGLLWPSSETGKTKLTIASRKKTVTEECFTKIRFLKSSLLRSESALRNHRQNKVGLTLPEKIPAENSLISVIDYDASAHAGSGTEEWTVMAALWGVLPLWRTAVSADVTLASRPITPGDCWPFRGSNGELIIDLSSRMKVNVISVEHVRPDDARSAPKRFHLYAILENGTWIRTLVGEYSYEGPMKQFYQTKFKASSKQLKLHILSNHGNKKYTCIYRIQIFGNLV